MYAKFSCNYWMDFLYQKQKVYCTSFSILKVIWENLLMHA